MRGGAVAVLLFALPARAYICGSTLVNGGPADLAAVIAVPVGGWPLTMNGRELNSGLAGGAGGAAPVPGDNNYTLYKANGKLYVVHSTKLPAVTIDTLQVHVV